jgi:hypothetical protein
VLYEELQDEAGTLVLSTVEDAGALARYAAIHGTMLQLLHLYISDFEQGMLGMLSVQVCRMRTGCASLSLASGPQVLSPGLALGGLPGGLAIGILGGLAIRLGSEAVHGISVEAA